MDKLEMMDRNSLSLYKEEVQRAAFRGFTPEKRFELWSNKLDEILRKGVLNEIEHPK